MRLENELSEAIETGQKRSVASIPDGTEGQDRLALSIGALLDGNREGLRYLARYIEALEQRVADLEAAQWGGDANRAGPD